MCPMFMIFYVFIINKWAVVVVPDAAAAFAIGQRHRHRHRKVEEKERWRDADEAGGTGRLTIRLTRMYGQYNFLHVFRTMNAIQ